MARGWQRGCGRREARGRRERVEDVVGSCVEVVEAPWLDRFRG